MCASGNFYKLGGKFLSFSEKLICLQKENGETNYRLAKELGVHATTVQNWRDGKKPLLEHAFRVATHYGKTVEESMGQERDVS